MPWTADEPLANSQTGCQKNVCFKRLKMNERFCARWAVEFISAASHRREGEQWKWMTRAFRIVKSHFTLFLRSPGFYIYSYFFIPLLTAEGGKFFLLPLPSGEIWRISCLPEVPIPFFLLYYGTPSRMWIDCTYTMRTIHACTHSVLFKGTGSRDVYFVGREWKNVLKLRHTQPSCFSVDYNLPA